MVTIGISAKLTLPIPDQNFGSFGQEVSFWGIDPEGDVEAQIKACVEATDPVSEAVHAQIASQIANLSGISMEGVGLRGQYMEFKEKVTGLLNRIVKQVRANKGGLDSLDLEKLGREYGAEVTVTKEDG